MFLTLPFGYYSKIDEQKESISESGHFYGFNDKMMINYFRYKVLLRRKSPPGVLLGSQNVQNECLMRLAKK